MGKVGDKIKSTQLIPLNNNKNTFIAEKRKVEAHAKIYLINKFKEFSSRYKKKKDAIKDFLELYNKGLYLKDVFKIIKNVSRSSLLSWIKTYEEFGTVECLISKYKYSKININILERLLFLPYRQNTLMIV